MFNTEIGTDVDRAKALLEQGELVAIPTETVYGLAGNGLNPEAIGKIYAAKNRPQFNPLILHVAQIEQMQKWVNAIPDVCKRLITELSPGPITYLLPKSALVPDLVTAGSSRVAIRIPAHELTLTLLSRLDFPLAAPSANPSGYVSPVSSNHVFEGLSGRIPYILEGGTIHDSWI
jgi:L-threonylcarbamoyladenylate synthase